MTILALEFSSERRSVALARDGKVLSEAADQSGGRGTKAFELIETALAKAGVTRESVNVIAVGLGPGSYTGIRAAIAIAQGWQLAVGVKLLGVSSAEAIAAQAQADQIFGTVNVVIDAQRGEFYLATWDIAADRRTEISALKIVSGGEVSARSAAGNICLGGQTGRVIFPSATTVAGLAVHREDYVSAEQLTPIYLREIAFVKAPPARELF